MKEDSMMMSTDGHDVGVLLQLVMMLLLMIMATRVML